MADNIDVQDLSDEDFEQMQASLDEVNTEVELEDTVDTVDTTVEDNPSEEEDDEDYEETESDASDVEVDDNEQDADVVDEPTPEVDDKESQEPQEEFNYKTSYEDLLKPLKVSGKEVTIKSADDLRALANMGIDYSRKMRDIKPIRAAGEALTDAGIIINGQVDTEKLSRLIDISNGNKDAIASLLAEQGIDAYDLDTEEVAYKPSANVPNDTDVVFRDVEQELISSGGIDEVVQAVSTLDVKSKQYFSDSPSELLKLNRDIESGVYEQIMDTVQYERNLGRLGDMSDMEAYIAIASNGNRLSQQEVQPEAPTKPKVSASRKKAAGISKRGPAKSKQQTYDYLSMSDDEFEALVPSTSLY